MWGVTVLLRRFAVTITFVLSAGLLAPATGHADASAPTTLYVNNAVGSNCSDAGTGTIAQPYCTIQAAVAVVNPGQTVYIEPGVYMGPIGITRSGTASAPITITAATPAGFFFKTSVRSTAASAAIAFTDVQYVDMSNIWVTQSVGDEIQISGSSDISLDRVGAFGAGGLYQPHPPAAGIHVTGGSNAVRIQRSVVRNAFGPSIEIDGGSTGTMLSTNSVTSSNGYTGIAVDGAPQTTITSNTVGMWCAQALAVGNGSTGAVIENNLLWDSRTQSAAACVTDTLTVDASAAPSAVADYNVLNNSAGGFEYSWGGSDYATAAAFAATGQGAHDFDAPSTENPFSSTPVVEAIDSADSAAPGELPTDVLGRSRVDDPVVPNTGVGPYTYYDRGAAEIQEPLAVNIVQSATYAPVGGSVTFDAVPTDAWATSFTYAFDFGDGTKVVTDSTGVEQHAYTATGTYEPRVTVTSSFGGTLTRISTIVVNPPAPLAIGLVGEFQNTAAYPPLTLNVNWLGSTTDSWNLTSATIDFGDCSAPFSTSGPYLQANDIHTYAVPGVYTVTLTVTDAGGNTARVSEIYSTPGASSYTGCGLKKILIAPSTAGGTPPGTTRSAVRGGLAGFGLDSIGSASVGGAAGVGSFSGGGLLGASAGVPR